MALVELRIKTLCPGEAGAAVGGFSRSGGAPLSPLHRRRMRRLPAPAPALRGAAPRAAHIVGDALRRLGKRTFLTRIVPAAKTFDYRTKLTLHVSGTDAGSGSIVREPVGCST